MTRYTRVVFASLTAAALLASAIATATARNLSTSEQNVRVTWASLEFTSEITEAIRCRITLEGSFHARTIAKVARQLIGAVTKAIIAHPCTNAEAWAHNGTEAEPRGTTPNTLPWHITYEGFSGTLPNITLIFLLLSRARFLVSTPGCQGTYVNSTDNVTGNVVRDPATGAITTLTPVAGRDRITLVTRLGGIFCPERGGFVGTAQVTRLASATRITITLI